MRCGEGVTLPGLARARSRLYGLLATGFSPPAAATVARLSRDGFRRAAEDLLRIGVAPGLAASCLALDVWLQRRARHGRRSTVRLLTHDYQRLFVGPYRLEAPPYESCYRGERRVMGDATLRVRRHYEEEGLALRPDVRELPDHVALELLFVACLAGEEARLRRTTGGGDLARCLHRQERFLREHLACWIGPFSDQVRRAARSSFYRALATVAAEFVTADAALVAAIREAAA